MPSYSLKVIKVPAGHLDPRRFKRVLENALGGLATDIKVDFDTTTQTWDSRPEFTIRAPSGFVRIIGTTNQIYGYVDHGTRPHPIAPKRPGGMLVFQGGYKSKTTVGRIGSRSGGKFGDTVATPSVQHPGTDPREFSLRIAKKWARLSPRTIQRAIDSLI